MKKSALKPKSIKFFYQGITIEIKNLERSPEAIKKELDEAISLTKKTIDLTKPGDK